MGHRPGQADHEIGHPVPVRVQHPMRYPIPTCPQPNSRHQAQAIGSPAAPILLRRALPNSSAVDAPGYSPELNPDEGGNGDLKQAVTQKEPARSKAQLKRAAIGHMRRLSKRPNRVRSFFGHKTFRYAA